MNRLARRILLGLILFAIAGSSLGWILRDGGEHRLKAFVGERPAHSIVFTSRTNTMSLVGAAAEGEGLTFPGMPQWQASEGRLRLLNSWGEVHELTWNRPLPDGGTLIDVMSPSVSADGKTIVFAGRRADDRDGGRFRIYSVHQSGSNLRPLTGGPDDSGCVSLPPMRWRDASQAMIPDEERRRIDYDDVDPCLLADGTLVFASSRIPDLDGSVNRRATQIWLRPPGEAMRTLSANRANDRWPHVLGSGMIAFSLWSRRDEVIADDGKRLVRYEPPRNGKTARVNTWMGAGIQPSSEFSCGLAKLPESVWRMRPLGDGSLVFMTPTKQDTLQVHRTLPGTTAASPSSLAADREYPSLKETRSWTLPDRDANGVRWSIATPTAAHLTGTDLLVAAAPIDASEKVQPHDYGVRIITQPNWTEAGSSETTTDFRLLFNDPEMVDAEPVTVVARELPLNQINAPQSYPATRTVDLVLSNGKPYHGPTGLIEARAISIPFFADVRWQKTDAGTGPIVPHFPDKSIRTIAFYSVHRDRFDDPKHPVIRGTLEHLKDVPVKLGSGTDISVDLPTGSPTMLVGLDANGMVATVEGAADSQGRRGLFYASAGDHVSGVRAGGYHFCTGCHAGHSQPMDIRIDRP